MGTSSDENRPLGARGELDVGHAPGVLVPAIVIGELHAGFALGNRLRDDVALLEEFIHEPFVQTIAIDDAIAARYGRVFAELRRAGTPIPINDVWIAASTLHVGGRLLTFDADFSHVRDLDVLLLVP